jgi:hypothetical protein
VPSSASHAPYLAQDLGDESAEQLQTWVPDVAAHMERLLRLQPDWDSYGALPPKRANAQQALDLVVRVAPAGTPAPAVVPTPSQGFQLEWDGAGVVVELVVDDRGARVFVEEGDNEVEGPLDPTLLRRTRQALARLIAP